MRLLTLSLAALFLVPMNASAQEVKNTPQYLDTKLAPLILPHVQHVGHQKVHYLNTEFEDPAAPNIKDLMYKKPIPAKTVEGQIDGLLFGINSYIDPVYDYYGHEIRRYMADVGAPSRMNNPADVLEAYKNIRRAHIVMGQWQEDMSAELTRLDEEAQNSASSARMKSKLTYNRNIIEQFFKDLEAWILANQAMTEFIFRNQGEIEIVYPLYYFLNFDDREAYMPLYIDRSKTLAAVQEYLPFAKMIY